MSDTGFAEDIEGQEPEETPGEAMPEEMAKLLELADAEGDISELLTEEQIATLGAKVVEDYERDEASRQDWKEKACKAQDRAAQEKLEPKEYPWKSASNVSFPLLTVAALQFAARAYPAIVKNDEAVMIKVFGQAPTLDPQIKAMADAQQPPTSQEEAQKILQAREQVLAHAQASQRHRQKKARAKRVGDYLNYKLFYEMDDWEGDTDALLHQLPIVGCGFRKVWYDHEAGECKSTYVSALRMVVNQDCKNLETAPRVTEEIPDVYPYQITSRQRAGQYRDVVLTPTGEDDQAPRLFLEQHRLEDLDGDGVEEPYVVTVDKDSREVMRIEAAFSRQTVRINEATGRVVGFERFMPYEKYGFIPDLKGRFYDIGFGHLLDQMSEVINTAINQLVDAGHAQIAGGGFLSSGLRLQGAAQNKTIRFQPGEYRVVNAAPGQLQGSIYERTFPSPSPVAFQLLDMMLGAAKDITATKDVITGEAPSTAPVGTTLALIEQGLQVFVAIYKRVYRSLRGEFTKLYDTVGAFGNQEDYAEVVDDPAADLEADFSPRGKDIHPVSDPSAATKMQSMAKAQMLLSLTGRGLNDPAIYMRALTAFDIDEPEELIPQGPPPGAGLQEEKLKAEVAKDQSSAMKNEADAAQTMTETGAMNAALGGGIPGMAGPSGQPMGVPGPQGPSPGSAGPMATGVMGGGPVG